jgi:23S rRNA (adenine2030-N6)-methyltransferase
MHYRHSFHAGNFADVFKHILLVGLLTSLNRKDKPWCFVDTHAGAGDYDLRSEGAQRTQEWQGGIERLLAQREAPALVAEFLALVRGENDPSADSISIYPGSPRFAQRLARATDRLVLCEMVPGVADELKAAFRGDARVAVHVRDGYEAHALLPPPEKRGLILIDPPFERVDEFDAVAECIRKGAARFANGIYAAWYPQKNRHLAARFARRVARETGKPVLNCSLDIGTTPVAEAVPLGGVVKHPMTACGLLVVNPPFGFEDAARETVTFLARKLAQGAHAEALVEAVDAAATS